MELIVEVLFSVSRKIAHRFWRELTVLTALYVLWSNLKGPLGEAPASFLIFALLTAIFSIRPVRVRIIDFWRTQHQRNLFGQAFSLSPALAESPPTIVRVERGEHSTTVTARLQHGTTVEDLEKIREPLAVTLRLGSVRITRDQSDASLVCLKLITGSPLSGKILPYPSLTGTLPSFWDGIPVGILEEGDELVMFLPFQNLLIAGEPGSGKTVFMTILLMFLICCPDVKLHVFDGKELDLSQYVSVAENFVGCDINAANAGMEFLESELTARYATLRSLGLKKVTPTCGLGWIVVVIDEAAFYTTSPNGGKQFAEHLRGLLARGRAAGIVVIMATQKPSSDSFPTAIRDLVSLRVAFRCGSIAASAVVLGEGWAGDGFSAHTIPVSDRGVAYLLGDAGIPQLFRSYYVDESQETSAIDAVCELRELKQGDA